MQCSAPTPAQDGQTSPGWLDGSAQISNSSSLKTQPQTPTPGLPAGQIAPTANGGVQILGTHSHPPSIPGVALLSRVPSLLHPCSPHPFRTTSSHTWLSRGHSQIACSLPLPLGTGNTHMHTHTHLCRHAHTRVHTTHICAHIYVYPCPPHTHRETHVHVHTAHVHTHPNHTHTHTIHAPTHMAVHLSGLLELACHCLLWPRRPSTIWPLPASATPPPLSGRQGPSRPTWHLLPQH